MGIKAGDDIKMWEHLMPRPIVLPDFEGEAKLNRPLEKLGNTTGPMPFDGNANIADGLRRRIPRRTPMKI